MRELLENRKKTILQNICAADARAQEVQEKMNKAILKLEKAKEKAIEIREQGIIAAQREKNSCIEQAEDGIRDLVRSRGLGDVYKRQIIPCSRISTAFSFAFSNCKIALFIFS